MVSPLFDHCAYPACQFVDDRRVLGLAEVLRHIGLDNPWTALALLITPDDQLSRLSPLDALQRDDARLKDLTVRLARGAGGDGLWITSSIAWTGPRRRRSSC